jgi:hypothetical protein
MKQMIVGATSLSLLLALKEEAEKRGFEFNPEPGRNKNEIVEKFWLYGTSSERHLDFYDKYNTRKTFSFSNNHSVTHTLPQDWNKVIANLEISIIPDIKVQLNQSYEAIVSKDKVQVGCQLFTFEVIEELYKAVQTQRSK